MWGSTYRSNSGRVFILKKKIIGYYLQSLSILTLMFFLKNRRFSNSLTFIYTRQVNLCIYLKVYFLIIFVIWLLCKSVTFALYYKLQPILHTCRTNVQDFQGPKFLKSLSTEIQNSENICFFGKTLKSLLSYLNILFVELLTSPFPFFVLFCCYCFFYI